MRNICLEAARTCIRAAMTADRTAFAIWGGLTLLTTSVWGLAIYGAATLLRAAL